MSNLKTLISRALCHTPLQYFPVRVRKGIAQGAHWTLLPYSANWRGKVEQDVEMAVRHYGTISGATCWDLGTHFGIYTVGMAMAVGSTGQVAGFEPDPISFERCKQHTLMNSLTWVKLFNVAASDVDGERDLIVDNGSGATTSHIAYESESHTGTTPVTRIRTLRLDSLVTTGEIRLPNFMKVDVEGHGHKALKGAMESIKTSQPVIVMSFHSGWEVEGVIELLRPIKYQPYTCEGSRIKWPAISFCQTLVLQR